MWLKRNALLIPVHKMGSPLCNYTQVMIFMVACVDDIKLKIFPSKRESFGLADKLYASGNEKFVTVEKKY